MPRKLTYEFVRDFINKETKLISTEYTNNKILLQINCNICNHIYNQSFDRYKAGHRHNKCSQLNNTNNIKALKIRYNTEIFIKDTFRMCIQCKTDFHPKYSKQKLCNKECKLLYNKSDTYRTNAIENGRKGGIISAENQQRRSKNEIHFAELCIEYFGQDDIVCNERIFEDTNKNKWDCDVFIKSLKIACLWDGNYHRKQINKNYNLKQVQERDIIKRKVVNS
jgi:hypothetical protein